MLHRSKIPARFWLHAALFFSPAALASAGNISALTTAPFLYSFAAQIAGDAASVEMLLPTGFSPHAPSLSPRELKKISSADAVIFNGLGLEPWLEKITATSGKLHTINASAGIERLMRKAPPASPPNPHVWLDPILAIKQVENIRDALSTIDRGNAQTYQANAGALIEKLRQLHIDIERATRDLPNKRVVALHNTFDYFAARYGLKIIAVIQPVHEREPTPKKLRALRELIQQEKMRVILTEPHVSPKLIESLAEDLDLKIAVLDPMESHQPSPQLYEKVMRSNLDSLVRALK